MTTRLPRPTPMRVTITPLPDGSRRIVLACRCARVGALFASWEPEAEALALLLAEHAERAPRCRHPKPLGVRA